MINHLENSNNNKIDRNQDKTIQTVKTSIHSNDEVLLFDFQQLEKSYEIPQKFSIFYESKVLEVANNPNSPILKELRTTIEKYPGLFYFKIEPTLFDSYYYSLVSINGILNIDDLIYECLAKIHSKRTDLKGKGNLLKKLSFLLRNKELSREILKYIFDNVVYLDFDKSTDFETDISLFFYKYSILNLIIQQYRRINEMIELYKIKKAIANYSKRSEEKSESTISSEQFLDKNLIEFLEMNQLDAIKFKNPEQEDKSSPKDYVIRDSLDRKLQSFSYFNEKIDSWTIDELPELLTSKKSIFNKDSPLIKDLDTSKDNTEVLANTIWESTFYIIENSKIPAKLIESEINSISNSEFTEIPAESIESKINSISNSEYTEIPAKSIELISDSMELICIITLYTTIVQETGIFLQNRILNNSSLFSKISHLPNFLIFCDSLVSNFRDSERLYKIIYPFLKRFNTTESNRILKRIENKLNSR